MFPRKSFLSLACIAGLLGLLGWSGLLHTPDFAAIADFNSTITNRTEPIPVARKLSGTLSRRAPEIAPRVPGDLADARNNLFSFYRALVATESGKHVTRILHYGDSPTTADSITSDVRSMLQRRFGDSGHGFILISKPWSWYGHKGIDVRGAGWKIEPASQSHAKDGLHGLGGVSFRGASGAAARFRLESSHASVEIGFLRQPRGGTLGIFSRDSRIGVIETDGAEKTADFAKFPIPPDADEIMVKVENGLVRLFGVSFEKSAPGVIYNSLGLNGAQVQVVMRYFDETHWTAQLQHQSPDLVVINYGTNESVYSQYIDKQYAGELREVVRRVRTALPASSVLIMSPMDRGQRQSDGQIGTPAALTKIVEIQRRIAEETGCAFFNTFEAMGGAGTMGRWYAMQPRLVSADFTHPLPPGAKKVGVLLYDALIAGYERYRGLQEPMRLTSKEPMAWGRMAREGLE